MLYVMVLSTPVHGIFQLDGHVGDAKLTGGDVSQPLQHQVWVSHCHIIGGDVGA
jgi:hypothetical protein